MRLRRRRGRGRGARERGNARRQGGGRPWRPLPVGDVSHASWEGENVAVFVGLELGPGHRTHEPVRLARTDQLRVVRGRLQPVLPHLPQRGPGLAAGAVPRGGPGAGAFLSRAPQHVAGRGHRHRRRAEYRARHRRAAGRPGPRGPAPEDGPQRHAPRRGRGASGRGAGQRFRRGRQGPLRQVSPAHGRGGHGRRGRGARDRDLPTGRAPTRRLLFPDHQGPPAHRPGPGHRARDAAARFHPYRTDVCAPGEEQPCPDRS